MAVRVTSDVEALTIEPGEGQEIALDLVNTSGVIDAVTTRVTGLTDARVRSRPRMLPLFPDAGGRLVLEIELPDSHPAGVHDVVVEICSHHRGGPVEELSLSVEVPTRAGVEMEARPQVVRARRSGAFVVDIANRGNTDLELGLDAVDASRSTRTSFGRRSVHVPAGGLASVPVQLRGPRLWFGGDRDQMVTVHADGSGVTADTPLTLRQSPLVNRGAMTAGVLVAVVALWTAAVLIGLTQVLGADPTTKAAPPSFFLPTEAEGTDSPDDVSLASVATVVPAGALAKDGLLPPGVGTGVSGVVRAQSSGEPVGGIQVDVMRRSRGEVVPVSSAATQADGSYSLAGLHPGSYLVRFRAEGYETTWYPGAADVGGGEPVVLDAQSRTEDVDVVVTGRPASIAGSVDAGDVVDPPTATVTARPTWTPAEGVPAPEPVQTQTDAEGGYELTGLTAPGTYDIVVEMPGYRASTQIQHVDGGQDRFVSDIRPETGDGQIAGVVTDGADALGGVEVTTTVDDETLRVGTPTVGQVGRFVLPSLPTPGTYVLTFAADGHAATSSVVELAAGQSVDDLEVSLAGGTGTVSGTVVDADGDGVGGAAVGVGGLADPVQTRTLTTGDVGAFTLTGLPAGASTVTVEIEGYQTQTVPVDVAGSGPTEPLQIELTSAAGGIAGTLLDEDGDPTDGVEVSATDAREVWQTTTAGGGDFQLVELPPGTYTLSVRVEEWVVASRVVEVSPRETADVDLRMTDGR